ncbi:MAG: YraN family protein [Akkermansia sp.]|nr:YraN family protein [Akkermansia sp.]MCC8147879.1 YraN family protein [Akkermansia sp.]
MGLVRSIAARLRRFHNWNCPSLNRAERNTEWVGIYGELAAASFLRAEGCSILRRNWRPVRGGELDIVCRDGECLVFVEVKTRTGTGYGGARRAVNARKRALIRQAAAEWMRQLPEPVPSRYDVVEVLYREGQPPECRRIRGAFGEKDLSGS